MDDKKFKLKILESIEKARKNLSADSETQITIDALFEDEDLDITLEREEFERCIKP